MEELKNANIRLQDFQVNNVRVNASVAIKDSKVLPSTLIVSSQDDITNILSVEANFKILEILNKHLQEQVEG